MEAKTLQHMPISPREVPSSTQSDRLYSQVAPLYLDATRTTPSFRQSSLPKFHRYLQTGRTHCACVCDVGNIHLDCHKHNTLGLRRLDVWPQLKVSQVVGKRKFRTNSVAFAYG